MIDKAIDKTNGNVAFICERFYIDVLLKEFNMNKNIKQNVLRLTNMI